MSVDNLYRGQLDIFDTEQFNHYGLTIVGCGSIGSFTAITLGKMGFKKMYLFDHDKIEKHNILTQFYSNQSIGSKKANCLRNILKNYTISSQPVSMAYKYKKTYPFLTPIVIVCTDNMESRKEVLQGCIKSKVRLLIDARMGGEAFTVFTVDLTKAKNVARYKKTLHKTRPEACTQKGIVYNVAMISSVIGSQLKTVMLNRKYAFEVNGDTCNLELYKND